MNHLNFYLFKILDLPEDESISVDLVETVDNQKYIHISKVASLTYCLHCSSRMHSKGIYIRKIKHPVLQDSTCITLIVKQRKWKCPQCGAYASDDFPFVEAYKQSTIATPLLVLNAMKDLNRTTASIARQYYLSDTQVHDIFTAYVDLPRLPLPKFLSIDEVFIDINEHEKYALVLMNFVTGEIVDILHNRYQQTASSYFYSIPREERNNVKCIISDAYAPYLNYPKEFFPNAFSVLDSFHVTKWLTSKLNDYINVVYKRYKKRDQEVLEKQNEYTNQSYQSKKESQEVILLKRYRWVLLKNEEDINYSNLRKYHKALGMYVDTYTIEKMFFALDSNFQPLRILKEEYITFNSNKYESREEIVSALTALIQKFRASGYHIFQVFSTYLEKYEKEIISSFIIVEVSRKSKQEVDHYYARLSNGPMESFNRKPKDYKRNTRGSSNFNYTRNRILWATRKNPSILATPKPLKQVRSYEGKKRGLYKKKK